MANKKADAKGWTLVKRGNTYTVMHRYTTELNPNGKPKQIGVSTGKSNYEEALQVALEIVKEARIAQGTSAVRGSVMVNSMKQMVTPIAESKYKQEEEKFLGNELDKTNPRLSTLWAFGETYAEDTGLYCDYLRNNKSPNVFLSRRPTYKHFFSTLSDKGKGVSRVQDIAQEHINDYFTYLMEAYPNAGTQHHKMISIRMFFNWLNAKYKIAIPTYLKQGTTLDQFTVVDDSKILTNDEIIAVQSFLSAKKNPNFLKLFLIGLHTGMRKGELTHLRWEDINFNTGRITVTTHNADPSRGIQKSWLKNRRSHRVVPIREVLKPYLKEWFDTRNESDPYILEGIKNRTQWSVEHVCKEIQEFVPKMHIHILRHTFISNALQLNTKDPTKPPASPVEVAMWVGDSVNMILSVYSHFVNTGNINNW
jgi:integrase